VSQRVATGSRPLANGLGIGPSEAETFWTEFLRSLRARGLGGVRLVISDAHTGLKAAIARVFEATWQRCRVHWMRNALAHGQQAQTLKTLATSLRLTPQSRYKAEAAARRIGDHTTGRKPWEL